MVIVETDNQWIKVKDLFYNQEALRKLVTENWSVEIFWFPFNKISKTAGLWALITGKINLDDWDPKEDEIWVRRINKREKVTIHLLQLVLSVWNGMLTFLIFSV